MTIEKHFLETTAGVFKNYKNLAEKSFAQLQDDEEFHFSPDQESNSITTLIKHISGNMISRWTDFLTSDGEKPYRNRDEEFIDRKETRKQLMEMWDKGWGVFFKTLNSLNENDLLKKIIIRGEELTVMQALMRQVAHYSYHIGQIVYLAKQLKAEKWKSLSIPKNQSTMHMKGNYLDNIK
ncbi:MAG TPA: DinB family protein [Chitinophagales bacterium]|nr:DinB family protein [Chitinophagales bacterium]